VKARAPQRPRRRRRRLTRGELHREGLDAEHLRKSELLREFVALHGWVELRVNTVFRGVNLFSWVRGRRLDYREGTIRDFLVPLLDALPGWTWDPVRDRHRRNIDNLRAFVRRNGWQALTIHTVVDGVHLNPWCATRRGEYHRGTLPRWIAVALEAIPRWSWDPIPELHAERVSTLRRHAEEHGLERLRLQTIARDGTAIGKWANHIRDLYRRGRVPSELIRELESVDGWTWEPRIDRQRLKLHLLRRFVERQGWSAVRATTVIDGERVGRWLHNSRDRHRNAVLPLWLQRELEAIPGWSWAPRSKHPG
jgi:hypothetical protein